MVQAVVLALLAVVLAEGLPQARQWIDNPFGFHRRPSSRELAHQAIHVFKLPVRRPAGVMRGPVRTRLEPDGEGFREVLVGMTLRIPVVEMLDEAFAVRLRRVVLGILCRGIAKKATACRTSSQRVR